jgi:large subunit ribosomal protein L29
MLVKEMRDKSASDLNNELLELRKEQFKMRMQRATGQLSNPARFQSLRKEIAQIMTVLNEKSRLAS